jgi:hypothetical protein
MSERTAFDRAQALASYPDGIERNFWHQARGRIVTRLCKPYRAEPLLEIGAGRGYMLHAFQERGWQSYGVELSNEMTPFLPNLPIQYGQDAFSLPENLRNQIRSIGLFDVIEHLPDRVAFLVQCRTAFPNLQYLYITVPACMSLWTNYDTYYGHYLRYDFSTLRQEIEASGYKVLFMRYFFHALYVPIWLVRQLSPKGRNTEYKPPSGINALFHKLVAIAVLFRGGKLPSSGDYSGFISALYR